MSTTAKVIGSVVLIGLLFIPIVGEIEAAVLAVLAMIAVLWGLK